MSTNLKYPEFSKWQTFYNFPLSPLLALRTLPPLRRRSLTLVPALRDFVVNPLLSLWRGTSHSTKVMAMPIQRAKRAMFQSILLILFILSAPLHYLDKMNRIYRIEEVMITTKKELPSLTSNLCGLCVLCGEESSHRNQLPQALNQRPSSEGGGFSHPLFPYPNDRSFARG